MYSKSLLLKPEIREPVKMEAWGKIRVLFRIVLTPFGQWVGCRVT